MSDYLIHFNKNHDPKTGQFAKGDGNGDGKVGPNGKPLNGDGREKGVYSAKIENYKKGTAFRDAYYIDKNGNKRSYQSYKEMLLLLFLVQPLLWLELFLLLVK